MTNNNPISRSISGILGIETIGSEYSAADPYHGLGFSIVHKIITNAQLKPIIIDMTVQAKKKWTAMGFGETDDEAKNHLIKYISSVREIIEARRSILLHPEFEAAGDTILCKTATVLNKNISEQKIDSHLITLGKGMTLLQYIKDIFPDNTSEKYNADTKYSPQQNALYLYSLFCGLVGSNNYIFISVPVTRRSIDSKKEFKRELIGGVFLVLQNNGNRLVIETVDNLALKIITSFHKGLIDWQENRNSIYDIDISTWLKIRNIGNCYLETNNPHHWPFGGSADNTEKEIHKTAVAEVKNNIVQYVNDIDTHPSYEWESWEKPPIRALVQIDSLANDLSNFFALLENSLSSKFKFKVVFNGIANSSLHYDTLWFNAIALGKAIFYLCEGFQQLKDEDKKNLATQTKVVVEWGMVCLENNNYLYLKLYEWLDISTGRINVQYVKDCWKKSQHSLVSAFPLLQNSGVNNMIYSGYDYLQKTYKSQEISLVSGEYNSKDIEIGSYKKSPPFLFLGIEAGREKLYVNAVTDNADKSSVDILNLFKREYDEDNCY